MYILKVGFEIIGLVALIGIPIYLLFINIDRLDNNTFNGLINYYIVKSVMSNRMSGVIKQLDGREIIFIDGYDIKCGIGTYNFTTIFSNYHGLPKGSTRSDALYLRNLIIEYRKKIKQEQLEYIIEKSNESMKVLNKARDKQ